jgi:hypothetical protein
MNRHRSTRSGLHRSLPNLGALARVLSPIRYQHDVEHPTRRLQSLLMIMAADDAATIKFRRITNL